MAALLYVQVRLPVLQPLLLRLPLLADSVTANQTICSGSTPADLTLSGYTGNIVKWQKASDAAFTTPVDIANTSATLSGTAIGSLTATTYFRAVVQSGNCSSANSSAATITVSAVSVGGAVASNQAICSGSTPANLTLSGNTGSVVKWQKASDAAFTTPTDIANTSTTLTGATIGALTATTYFRAVVQNSPCSVVYSSSVTITVNPLPAATISAPATVCQNASPNPVVTFTGANGTAPYTFTYKINSGTNQTITSTGNTATVNIPLGTVTSYTYTLVSVSDNNGCSQAQSGSATVNVLAPPAAFIVTPSSAPVCLGNIQSLYASASAPTTGSVTFSNNTGYSIPNAGIFGGAGTTTSTIVVSGVPAGAIINSVSVNFNVTDNWDDEFVFNLKAPNGNVLNLVNEEGANGSNFTNTIISSTSTNPVSGGTAAFTNTYSADAAIGVGGPSTSNVTSFSSLTGTPNGSWIFDAADEVFCEGNFCSKGVFLGTLNNWSITINYTVPAASLSVVWSPNTDLYTDAGATTAYTGTAVSTVYAKPSTTGVKTYMATETIGGCSTSETATLTVNPSPVVTITADYCAVSGKVVLTANSIPAATSYVWTGGTTTTQKDTVDESGNYTVTAYTSLTCPGSATISVANELVVNGNFESGNGGFTTAYTDHTGNYYNPSASNPALTGLWPEGDYAVDSVADYPTNGIGYHPAF